jgi:hypothetical protein
LTKRQLFSLAQTLYDPLGVVNPIILSGNGTISRLANGKRDIDQNTISSNLKNIISKEMGVNFKGRIEARWLNIFSDN